MKKVKLDDKSKFMYALIICVIIIAAAFLLGYRKFEDKATTLAAQTAELEVRIESLKQYYETEEQNKADTETMTKEIVDVFKGYRGDARFEDAVYEAFNLYDASLNTLEYDAIGFEAPFAVKEIPLETVQAAEIEGLDQAITFYQFNVSYAGKVLYEGVKGMATEICDDKDYNMAIGEMNYQLNDDGYIDGKTLVSFYFVDGAGCPYSAPPVAKYETGLSNLFGVTGSLEAAEED